MLPDAEYIQLYELFSKLMEEHSSSRERRVVYYQPDLFIEMAQEIIKLRKRIAFQQHLELDYEAKAMECLRLCDTINAVRKECKLKHIKLDTRLELRTRK